MTVVEMAVNNLMTISVMIVCVWALYCMCMTSQPKVLTVTNIIISILCGILSIVAGLLSAPLLMAVALGVLVLMILAYMICSLISALKICIWLIRA